MLSLDPHSLDDVLATVQQVGDRAGVGVRAAGVVAGLRARLDRERNSRREKAVRFDIELVR